MMNSETMIIKNLEFVLFRHHRLKPSRIVVSYNLYLFDKYQLVIINQNTWNIGGGIDAVLEGMLKELPVKPEKIIFLSRPSSEHWRWHTFDYENYMITNRVDRFIADTTASELMNQFTDFTPYLAMQNQIKLTTPKKEVANKTKTH